MSETLVRLNETQARTLTDEVKLDAERLWRKLVELYDGLAWESLGYGSWREYWITEFGEQSLNLSYKQIAAGRVSLELERGVYHGTKPSERQARELAPLLDQPETLREAWAEVIQENPEPTAKDIRDIVQRKMDVHYSSARRCLHVSELEDAGFAQNSYGRWTLRAGLDRASERFSVNPCSGEQAA